MVSTLEQVNKQSGSTKAAAKQNWLVFLCKIIACQLAAVLLVEICLSIAGLGEEEIYKLDPVLGVKHMSNKKVTWRSEGLASSYFNEDGLRETKVRREKAAGVYRIALLGDSLTESLQVPVEKSFGHQAESLLTKQLGRPVEVINFGVSGYSTVQEYLQLKQQVIGYKPDLVLLCYNSRDCFENWSPPDEVLTNVRPAALQLPGRPLLVDSSPVRQWMKTPRARFLKQFEWLREHSRLWGIFAAAEIDWSMHNETYKQLVFFLTKPGKALRKFSQDFQTSIQTNIASLKQSLQKSGTSSVGTSAAAKTTLQKVVGSTPRVTPQIRAAASSATAEAASREDSPEKSSAKLHQPNDKIYQQVINQTLGSLLVEMRKTCSQSGAQFAVVALPVRSALSGRDGLSACFNNLDYNDELIMLQSICKEKGISYINIHEQAKALDARKRDELFFLVHFKPDGHKFVASQLTPQLQTLMSGRPGETHEQ